MTKRGAGLLAATALAVLLQSAAPASAATPLGQVAPLDPSPCADGNFLQSTISSGTPYTVPAGGGVITTWQSRGRMTTPGTGRLQVWRFTPGSGYTLVGRSAVETFTAGAAPPYLTQIPVAAGDVLGLRIDGTGGAGGCYFTTASSADVMQLDTAPDPAPGDTLFFITGQLMSRVNVAATLEPDADCDGLGDETQDPSIVPTGCNPAQPEPEPGPGDTTPPETTITEKPKDKTKRKQATFEFTSSEPGSSFACAVDGQTLKLPCTSPYTVKVKKGKHTFQVRATDQVGNADPTPATDSWKVKRKNK
jgi:hypothetical protein